MARVLIVDDDESARILLGAILKTGGHDTSFATSGEEALHAFLRTELDAVVTDLHMPFGGGVELIEAIKGLSPDVPIIAVSGSHGPATLLIAGKAGACATLSKPVDPSDLLAAVQGAVNSAGQ